MKKLIIYDSEGMPTLIILRNGRIIDFNGLSIGFIKGIHVFDYNGNHRGFFEGGILRDHEGFTVGFTDDVYNQACPMLPLKKMPPLIPLAEPEPLRPFTEIPPFKPSYKSKWAEISPFELFEL